MRIISKYPDYYDGVQQYVSDDPDIYVRKIRRENIDSYLVSNESMKTNLISFWKRHPFETVLIGFCGKIYPAVKMSYYIDTTKIHERVEYIYDIEHMDKFIEDMNDKSVTEKYYEDNVHNYPWHGSVDSRIRIVSFFDKWHGSTEFEQLFFEFKSPIFTLKKELEHKFNVHSYHNTISGDMSFRVNDTLKRFNFQKVFDPYIAYQEIQMYLFGVLGCTEKETVNISDKDMRNQKGFDDMSFKKYPTKRLKK